MRRRFTKNCAKLFVIDDTPHSIALGAAFGVFLGFAPLFGLKTLLALLMAIVFRVNKIAAVVAVSLHDLLFPFWPVVYRLEYDIGYWLLHQPHQLPPSLNFHGVDFHAWLHWKHFASIGGPMLCGSVMLGAPTSLLAYSLLKRMLARRRQQPAEADAPVQ